MSKLSLQVENQLASAGKVCASARIHASKISAALAALAKEAQGNNSPATAAVFEIVLLSSADRLDYVSKALYSAELKLSTERADDIQPRLARDTQHHALLDNLVHVRGIVELSLGADSLKSYGLHGETPRNTARATLNHASNVIHLMEQQPVSTITGFGTVLDTSAIVAALKAKAGALEASVATLETESRELEDALSERNRAAALWSETYRGVADTLTGMYRLAGWVELAERVRPTARVTLGDEVVGDLPEGESVGGSAPGP